MTSSIPSFSTRFFVAVSICFSFLISAAVAQPPPGRTWASDKRAEDRTYHFADTNEDLPYCVFASSKISANKPAPLIVSLHGLGAPPQVMCNTTAVDLAEEGGYILVAPMGYNVSGWYGSPVITPGAGAPVSGNSAAPGPEFSAINQGGESADDHLTLDEVKAFFANGPFARGNFAAEAFGRWDSNSDGKVTEEEFANRPQQPRRPPVGFGGGDQPENLTELSEKDVLNVLAMIRKEFNVDDKRIYLTGHSMGGAGTLFMGSKHADIFAAIAPVAPAAFAMTENRAEILQKLKDNNVPVMLVHGATDEVVPVDLAHTWAATMKEIDMEYEYVEQPGVTHGPVITESQKPIYEFFNKHSK